MLVGWIDTDDVRLDWGDAPDTEERLVNVLYAAYEQCLAYAPALPVGTEVPRSYAIGQLMHAKDIWSAMRAQATVNEEFTMPIRVMMGKATRQQFRPLRGTYVIG